MIRLFGPITTKGIANKVLVNLHPTTNTLSANGYDQVVTQPAMFANGSPTTDVSLSVPSNQINANNDFGIASNIFNY